MFRTQASSAQLILVLDSATSSFSQGKKIRFCLLELKSTFQNYMERSIAHKKLSTKQTIYVKIQYLKGLILCISFIVSLRY